MRYELNLKMYLRSIFGFKWPRHGSGGQSPAGPLSRVRSRVIPCYICCGQSCTGKVFTPSSSIFRCLYHSTNTPYSYSSTRCFYRKDNRAKSGNLRKSNVFRKSGSTG